MPVKKQKRPSKPVDKTESLVAMDESTFNKEAGVPEVGAKGRPVKQRNVKKVDDRVDVIITFSRIGTHKVVTGKYTGEQIFIYAVVGKSFGVDGSGKRRPGVNILDAEEIEATELPFYCPRTQEWCKVRPFRIVI